MFKQLTENFPTSELVLLDLGNFSDNPTEEGTLKTRALVEAMSRLGYAAANVGERDLSLGYDEFLLRTEGASFPFVSCNIVRQDTQEPVFAPYVVIDVPRPNRPPVRVGILGVVRFNPVFLKSGPDDSNLVTTPPSKAVSRYVAEVRERADLVVLLAALHKDDAHMIAREVAGIDAILGTYGAAYSTQDEIEGKTFILYSGYQGRRIGETRIFLNSDGLLDSAMSFMHVLTARYPTDPEMLEFVNRVAMQIDARKKAAQDKQVGGVAVGGPETTDRRRGARASP